MTENEIYCYVNGFLKWNISKNKRAKLKLKVPIDETIGQSLGN